MSIIEKPEIKDWLDECRTSNTRTVYTSAIKRFFKWYQGTFEDFMKLDPKEMRHVLITYQNERETVENHNTIRAVITAFSSFLQFLDKPINLKGKRIRGRPDVDSHIFNNGDLAKMFNVANTKEKCILALGASLGWEISAVVELDRNTMQNLVARAKAENKQFFYFPSIRKKTGANRLGVLNPLALEWLEKWLNELEKIEKERIDRDKQVKRKRKMNRKNERPISNLFDLTPEAINKMLRRLIRHAGIVTTGRVHFHKIRGWVMSGLSRSGFNEFQIKYLVGKAIPMQDMTYLQTLQQEIEERYPKAYEQFLNINLANVKIEVKGEEFKTLQMQVKDLTTKLAQAEDRAALSKLQDVLEKYPNLIEDLIKIQQPKQKQT